MKFYHSNGIVLKKKRFSEGDAIVTVFTERYGKISLVARGLYFFKNRFHGKLEPSAHVSIRCSGKDSKSLPYLNSCELLGSFEGIEKDLGNIFTALYFLDIIDSSLRENDPNAAVFHLLHASLSILEKGLPDDTLVRVFELRLLSLVGYFPKLGECVNCETAPKQETFILDFERGGIVCGKCAAGRRLGPSISQGALNFAQRGIVIKYQNIGRLKIPKRQAKEIEILSHHFLVSKIGKELKSYRFLGLR